MTRTLTTGLTTLFSLVLLAILLSPVSELVIGDTDTFSASVTVSNIAPVVNVDVGQVLIGTVANARNVSVFFNVTDQNGNGDINTSTAVVVLNQSGETDLQSLTCVVDSQPDSNTNRYNCTFSLPYYAAPGTWSINATIEDNSGNSVENVTETLTINTLDGIDIVTSSISFSGSPGTNDNAASPNPQQVNNTGNLDYAEINLTGYAFVNGADTIDVGNVTVNVTNTGGAGTVLINDTAITIGGAALNAGESALQDLYFWLDVPAATNPGTYNAESAWIVEASQ